MSAAIQDAAPVREARGYVERGLGVIDTLDLGPLDANIAQAADYLRTAAALLEEFGRRNPQQ